MHRGHLALLALGLALAGVAVAGACFSEHTPTSSTPVTPPASGGAVGSVTVGDIFFQSARNNTRNPAVDTVASGSTVTWTWASTASLPHSVESTGSPSFTSSAIQTGGGSTYQFTFTTPGTYQYDCVVHGQLMTGRIVVQ